MRLMAIALAAAGAVSLLAATIPAQADEVVTRRVIVHHHPHHYGYHYAYHRPYHRGGTTIVTETVHH